MAQQPVRRDAELVRTILEDIRRLKLRGGDLEWFDLEPYLCPGWIDNFNEDTPGSGAGARYAVLHDLLILSGNVYYDASEISADPDIDIFDPLPEFDALYLVNAGHDAMGTAAGSKPNLPIELNNYTHATAQVQADNYATAQGWALGYTWNLQIGFSVEANGVFIPVAAGYSAGGRPVDTYGRTHAGVPHFHGLALDGVFWRIGNAESD